MNGRAMVSTIIACVATGASMAGAQQPPKVRPLGPIVKVSTEPLGSVASVRHLPGGRVLVNDIVSHRVLLFDSTFTKATVVADSTSATANAYGARPGGLIAYRGDSTLFVDPASLSMLVIDPMGKIARVISAPRPDDINYLVGGPFGTPGFDGLGRLVYRGGTTMIRMGPSRDGKFKLPEQPDSAPVVRVDLATRKLDTVAFFKIPKNNMSVTQNANGDITGIRMVANPLPLVDDWAILQDGSVAVLRGRDYHVDWVNADGSRVSTAKMPFEWEHMDDDQKAAFIDSAKAVATARNDSMRAAIEKMGPEAAMQAAMKAAAAGDASGRGGGGGGGGMAVAFRMGAEEGAARGARGGPGGAPTFQLPTPLFVDPKDLPDYKPPFLQGASRPDADGNLWVRTTRITDGRAVYDIVNRKGELIDRVQLPAFRTIAGFGPGVVYMGVRDMEGIVHLERARVK